MFSPMKSSRFGRKGQAGGWAYLRSRGYPEAQAKVQEAVVPLSPGRAGTALDGRISEGWRRRRPGKGNLSGPRGMRRGRRTPGGQARLRLGDWPRRLGRGRCFLGKRRFQWGRGPAGWGFAACVGAAAPGDGETPLAFGETPR